MVVSCAFSYAGTVDTPSLRDRIQARPNPEQVLPLVMVTPFYHNNTTVGQVSQLEALLT